MGAQIDKRPIWLLLILKGLRPIFFVAVAIIFFQILSTDLPDGLTAAGRNAIAVFILCLILWVSNAVPLAITSLFAIVLVPFLGILSTGDTYAIFGNEAVFFILGAFILAGAVMHSGLSNRIALAIMKRFGASPRKLLLSIFFLAAVLSFFMSEHAVAAMLFPIVFEIAKGLKLRPGRSNYGKLLFLSLAWGCVIGGVATFLGGARVPLAVGILKETTGQSIDFLTYTVAVFPIVVVLLTVGAFLLPRLFPIEIESVEEDHKLLADRIKALGKPRLKEYLVGFILVLTVAAWMIFGHRFGLASIALTAVVVLFVFKLVRWKDIEEYVNWGIILMYGGAITLGTALERSGAAEWVANRTIGEWGSSPVAIIAILSLLTLVLTEGISNAAVIAILLPIAIGIAGKFSLDPMLLTFAIAVPAGLAFSLPMSTPANAIAVSSNYITVRDLARSGIIMSITAWVVFNIAANYYWPLIGLWGS